MQPIYTIVLHLLPRFCLPLPWKRGVLFVICVLRSTFVRGFIPLLGVVGYGRGHSRLPNGAIAAQHRPWSPGTSLLCSSGRAGRRATSAWGSTSTSYSSPGEVAAYLSP